jgi:hypothetical protein
VVGAGVVVGVVVEVVVGVVELDSGAGGSDVLVVAGVLASKGELATRRTTARVKHPTIPATAVRFAMRREPVALAEP